MATAMGLASLVGMRRVAWTGAEDKTTVESKSYYDQQRECFRRSPLTIYLESNDLRALCKTIRLVAESMRGWPANAHP